MTGATFYGFLSLLRLARRPWAPRSLSATGAAPTVELATDGRRTARP